MIMGKVDLERMKRKPVSNSFFFQQGVFISWKWLAPLKMVKVQNANDFCNFNFKWSAKNGLYGVDYLCLKADFGWKMTLQFSWQKIRNFGWCGLIWKKQATHIKCQMHELDLWGAGVVQDECLARSQYQFQCPQVCQWLSGLGVWFLLWVQEVPGSNPGWALKPFIYMSLKLNFKLNLKLL